MRRLLIYGGRARHTLPHGRFLWAPAASIAPLLIGAALSSLGITSCEVHPVGSEACIGCHDGRSASSQIWYARSPHARAGVECEDCHGPGEVHLRYGGQQGFFINNPGTGSFENSYTSCIRCHAETVGQFLQSLHAVEQAATCHSCHRLHQAFPLFVTHEDNRLCLVCHGQLGFDTNEAVTSHTFHPNDPERTGAGRCTSCHMFPLQRTDQENGLHSHTMLTRRPIFSNLAAEAGIDPVPPNSCAGITGCHDGTVPDAPIFDVDDRDQNIILDALVRFRHGEQHIAKATGDHVFFRGFLPVGGWDADAQPQAWPHEDGDKVSR